MAEAARCVLEVEEVVHAHSSLAVAMVENRGHRPSSPLAWPQVLFLEAQEVQQLAQHWAQAAQIYSSHCNDTDHNPRPEAHRALEALEAVGDPSTVVTSAQIEEAVVEAQL